MAFQVYSYALTTRQKVKDLIGVTDTSLDTIIDQMINTYTDFVENYCGGRRFLSTAYVEIYDANAGSSKIFLNQRPAISVTSVEFRGGTISTPIWNVFSADSYMVYLKAAYLHFFSKFTQAPQAFRVTYQAGFLINWTNEGDNTTHTLPADLSSCVTEMIANKLNTRKSQGILSESTEGQSITYDASAKDLTSYQKEILGAYKMFRYAI